MFIVVVVVFPCKCCSGISQRFYQVFHIIRGISFVDETPVGSLYVVIMSVREYTEFMDILAILYIEQ